MILLLFSLIFQFQTWTVHPDGCPDGRYAWRFDNPVGAAPLVPWWTDDPDEDGWIYAADGNRIVTDDNDLYIWDMHWHNDCAEVRIPPPQLVLVVLTDPAPATVTWSCGGGDSWTVPVDRWNLYNDQSQQIEATPVSVFVLSGDIDLDSASCHVVDQGRLWYTYGREQVFCMAVVGRVCGWLDIDVRLE